MNNQTDVVETTPTPASTKKGGTKGKKSPSKAKKGGKKGGVKAKGKHPKAGTVIKVKRSKDFQRIKRIGDKEHKVDLTRYEVVVSAGGNSSLDNGDEVAQLLRGKSLDEVYKIAAKHTETPEVQLRKNYEHLNVGMQRMNLGNKLRAVLLAAE